MRVRDKETEELKQKKFMDAFMAAIISISFAPEDQWIRSYNILVKLINRVLCRGWDDTISASTIPSTHDFRWEKE